MQRGDLDTIPAVSQYLLDTGIYDALEEVAKTHNISVERSTEMLDLRDAYLTDQIELEQFPLFIGQAFGLDEDAAKRMSADLVGFGVLPLENYIPGVADQIRAWGGDPAVYEVKRVEKEVLNADDVVKRLAEQVGLELPAHLMKRFIYLSKGYLTKERARDVTEKFFARSSNIGGLELSADQISAILAALDEQREFFQLRSEIDKQSDADHLAAGQIPQPKYQPKSNTDIHKVLQPSVEQPKSVATHEKVGKVPPKTSSDVVQAVHIDPPKKPNASELIQQILDASPNSQKIQEAVSAKSVDITPKQAVAAESPAQEVQQAKKAVEHPRRKEQQKDYERHLAQAMQTADVVWQLFRDKRLTQSVFHGIVRSHVTGVRDPHKTEQMLADVYRFKPERIKQIMQALEQARSAYHQPVQIQEEKMDAAPAVSLKQQEASVLDARHSALTKSVSTESVEPVLPHAQVSAARTKQQELKQQQAAVSSDDLVKAQAASRPQKAKTRLTVQSLPPSPATEKLVDVRYARSLSGPVEELGRMGVVEFRRLSSDPSQAVRKVADRFDVLEQTSYEERVRGIRAWRHSPVMKLYRDMSKEALVTGMKLAEIAAKRRERGEESLSPNEIAAIIDLNSKTIM